MSDTIPSKRSTKIKIRLATANDIEALINLNRDAYPVKGPIAGVWEESHLLSHQHVFPEGQLVAEIRGKIVGGAASLIVDMGTDPLRLHTWSGITDSGFFFNHDPRGDTLYGADVYVSPKARGKGVGAALYKARRELCIKLNLRRILAGGRLWNFSDEDHGLTPEEYVARVKSGERSDLVLNFQLSQGFEVRGVMPNYLIDPKGRNYASLIEWTNPEYTLEGSAPRKVRVSCVQYKMRKVKSFKDFAQKVTYFADVAGDYKSDFVLFPELFTVQLLSQLDALTPQEGMKELAKYTKRLKKLMSKLAVRYDTTIIAGSHPSYVEDKLYNICFVCLPDGSISEQSKIHITPNEKKWWGITGGDELKVIDTPKAKIGILICYDVEFPEAARNLSDEGMEILFVPFCTDNRQGYLRVRYCAHARAIENQVYVAIAGNVGNLPDVENMDVQYAQAAVLTPSDFPFARDGIAAEAEANEETVLICDLDLDDLAEARSFGTVTPLLDRRPDMFRYVSKKYSGTSAKYLEDGSPLGFQPSWGETEAEKE